MKKMLIIIVLIVSSMKTFSQSPMSSQAAASLRDSILTLKANYIGQPLGKLINDLRGNVAFSLPNGAANFTVGQGYYKDFILSLGKTTLGFKIIIPNKVWVDLAQYHKYADSQWDNMMIGTLSSQIVTSLVKH